ncbi:insulin-like growth factor-binding complex acid labile subunit, partial [Brachionus plicatilis]
MHPAISIGYLKNIIINYYDQLINNIDIDIEKYTQDNHFDDIQKQEIEGKRKKWIKKIESTRNDNILNLHTNQNIGKFFSLNNNPELLNYELFKNGFLFFTKEKIYGNPEVFFVGKLIYRTGYISEFSRKKFKEILSCVDIEGTEFETIEFLNREVVDYCVIKSFYIQSANKECSDVLNLTQEFYENLSHLNVQYVCIKTIEIPIKTVLEELGLKNLRILEFDHLGIEKFSKRAFEGLVNLEELVINHNLFTDIEGNSFRDLKNLKKLDLTTNKLDNLESDVFNGLDNLENFAIKKDVFKNLKNLKCLNLCRNDLSYLCSNIFLGLKELREIDLSYNLIEFIEPETFNHLKNLVNDLSKINRDTFKGLNSLEKLFIQSNYLNFIDKHAFDHVPNLNMLDLWGNKLEIIDDSTFNRLTSLEYLNISWNKLEKLNDRCLLGLENLKELNLK